mgnify:CR=1 FL=1
MSSVGLVREPVGHNLNLAVILAFISWVEPTLPVAATATCPFPRPAGGSLRTYANILYTVGIVPVRFSRNGKALFHYSKILYELDVKTLGYAHARSGKK